MWEMQTVVTEPVKSISQRIVIHFPVALLMAINTSILCRRVKSHLA